MSWLLISGGTDNPGNGRRSGFVRLVSDRSINDMPDRLLPTELNDGRFFSARSAQMTSFAARSNTAGIQILVLEATSQESKLQKNEGY